MQRVTILQEHQEVQQHLRELTAEEKRNRKHSYFRARNLGVILLEIFPSDRKDELAKGLKALFEATQVMELNDLRDKGILAGGWGARVGTIYPGNKPNWQIEPGNVYKSDLPHEFAWIDKSEG